MGARTCKVHCASCSSGASQAALRIRRPASQARESNADQRVPERTLKPLVSRFVFLNDRRRNAAALAHLLAALACPLPNF